MEKLNIDCLIFILNELKTDKNSLHSCLLLNREWCNLVVPILWEKYSWRLNNESKRKFFITILSCLPSSSKQFLLDNDIKLFPIIFFKPPLFNYISFCKSLNSDIIDEIVEMIDEEFNVGHRKRRLLQQEICKLFIIQCKNIKELLLRASLAELLLSFFPEAPTFFSKLYCLIINNSVEPNVLCEIAQICKDLNKLVISCHKSNPGLVSLVDAQKNLKCVDLTLYGCGADEELSKALAEKCNTIEDLCLTISSISTNTFSFLTSLINLKRISICIWVCDNYKVLLQCLKISEFSKLQYLCASVHSLYLEALVMLIEKTKGNILQVDIYFCDDANTEILIKAIANNCPKIEWLSTQLDHKEFINVKLLLLNCRNLVRLRFNYYNVGEDGNEDELLEILTKFSPKSLNNISLSGVWKYSVDAFEKFFESYRERNLLYFEINGYVIGYFTEDHKAIVRKYINEGVLKEFKPNINDL